MTNYLLDKAIKWNQAKTPRFLGTPLPDVKLYENMVLGGFTPTIAIVVTAVSLRESGGIPTAWNKNLQTGDNSLGLLQIDMLNDDIAAQVNKYILKGRPIETLLDPLVNAQAGAFFWNKNNNNLNTLWYINHTGTDYYTRYISYLPRAVAAACASPMSLK